MTVRIGEDSPQERNWHDAAGLNPTARVSVSLATGLRFFRRTNSDLAPLHSCVATSSVRWSLFAQGIAPFGCPPQLQRYPASVYSNFHIGS
jgi:hypothetical protein